MRTIRRDDTGAAVEDVQRRLRVLGYSLAVDGVYLGRTQEAVRQFREKEGLPSGDTVDERTWSALVDASFSLGDRTLYLRMPYFHGGDVRTLQNILNVLGFVTGDSDGIFGAHTERALREFQASVGLVDDGIAGSTTFDAIQRLRHAWEGKSPTSAAAEEHLGFARAAEALEKVEVCFYGLDALCRGIASRVSNLARATTPDAAVVSADALLGVPKEGTLMIGIATEESRPEDTVPVVELTQDFSFSKRLRTALDSARRSEGRLVIEVPAQGPDSQGQDVDGARWEQHIAVVLLDAFCIAVQ